MRVVLCCLAKKEHKYINDFVKWYVNLGFDTIYIYDNDELDMPNIKDFIDKKYMGHVEIINIRGVHKEKLQHDVYTDFYRKHSFDWCLFCDIDEFLFGVKEIHQFLGNLKFRNALQIRVKWRLFGDDDLITRDMSKPVYEVFKKEVYHTMNRNLVDIGNLEKQGKMFVRGNIGNVVIRSPHFASVIERNRLLPSILPSGRPCFSKVVINEDYSHECVFLHHYMTKSLTEFIEQKMNRTDAVFGDIKLDMRYYWRINKPTKEKIAFLENLGLI